MKSKSERSYEIGKELTGLCRKSSIFLTYLTQTYEGNHIHYMLLKMCEKCRKKKEYEVLNEVFDITLLNGDWLSSKDKEFCYLQVANKGAMGYSTGKIAVRSNSCLQVFQK